eukprot:496796-Pelagomonas_calceolata.AAC.1
MCRQLGGSSILPDHLPSPQAVLLDMRVAGAVDESGAKKVCRSVGVGVGKGIMHKYTGTGLLDMHVSKACDEKKGSNLLGSRWKQICTNMFVQGTKHMRSHARRAPNAPVAAAALNQSSLPAAAAGAQGYLRDCVKEQAKETELLQRG